MSGTLNALRSIPQIQKVLELPEMAPILGSYPRPLVIEALREGLGDLRLRLRAGAAETFCLDTLLAAVRHRLERRTRSHHRRVVNATGIVLHTNLGRAPLAAAAVEAVGATAAGYGNLEFDLDEGERGSRQAGVAALLCALTSAEAALVVNNNAAAVLLGVSALATGGETIVSRGEMIEIGGSFRIPDVIRQGGARLVEVGTTNRTRIADYEAAITADTRLLLKVHPSNYRVIGFAGVPAAVELVELGRRRDIPVMEDLGSGTLVDLRRFGLPREPTVRDSLAAGIDLVAFSGDKLLGGPQAGILLGRREVVERLERHPLMRALRPDKMTLAALEATLLLYRAGEEHAVRSIPVLRMLAQTVEELENRASRMRALLAAVPGLDAELRDGTAHAGGGALPETGIPTRVVAVACAGLPPSALAQRLRAQEPAVVGRVGGDRLLLDMLTIDEGELPAVAEALRKAVAS